MTCRYGQPSHTGIGQALSAYADAANAGDAPVPAPPHATRSLAPTSEDGPTDICYFLLQLRVPTDGEGAFVASALRSDSLTPDPADQLVHWRLLCLLQAVQALSTSQQDAPEAVRSLLPPHAEVQRKYQILISLGSLDHHQCVLMGSQGIERPLWARMLHLVHVVPSVKQETILPDGYMLNVPIQQQACIWP